MSIEGQGHFFTIYFPGFVCFVLYLAKISGERLQDHWSSGYFDLLFSVETKNNFDTHNFITNYMIFLFFIATQAFLNLYPVVDFVCKHLYPN